MQEHQDIHQGHDKIFKLFVSDKDCAADLLKSNVPAPLAQSIPWEKLHPLPGDFINPKMRSSFVDALFKVELKGTDIYLYILLEHTTSVDPLRPLDLLRYAVNIWEKDRAQTKRPRKLQNKLAPMFILVLNQGPQKWSAPLRFRDLIAMPEGAAPDLGPYQVDFLFHMIDLAALAPHEIKGNDLVASYMWMLKAARDGTLETWIEREWGHFATQLKQQDKWKFMEPVVTYLSSRDANIDLSTFEKALDKVGDEEVERIYMTIADQIEKRGEARGKLLGLLPWAQEQGLKTLSEAEIQTLTIEQMQREYDRLLKLMRGNPK